MLIAHTSHWLVNLLYLAPMVAFLAWLGVTTLKERRAEKDEPERKPKVP